MAWISATKRFRSAVRKKFLEISRDKKNKMCEEVILFQLLDVFTSRLDKLMYKNPLREKRQKLEMPYNLCSAFPAQFFYNASIIFKIKQSLLVALFMSLNLTVHVHVLVLARVFCRGSATMLENFSSLRPFLPAWESLSLCPSWSGPPFFYIH